MKNSYSPKQKAVVKLLLGVLLLCALIFTLRRPHQSAPVVASHPGTVQSIPAPAKTKVEPHTGAASKVAALPEKTKAVDSGCFLASYRHQELADHKNRKDCARHKNYLHFKAGGTNLKSVCVRLNGTPVAYEFIQEKNGTNITGIMLSPIAAPDSEISIHYCLNGKNCPSENIDCKIPKDEFMDAIGGEDSNLDRKTPIVKWDPTDPSDTESDVVAEIDSDLKKELADADLSVFEGWIGNDEAVACTFSKINKDRLAGKN